MIAVGRLAPNNQWDQNMLDLLFANMLYPTGLMFKRYDGYPAGVDGCILIIPGRYWADRTNEISEAISRYRWVLAIRTGDEENVFDPERVFHRNIKWWVQTPRPGHDYDGARLFGIGFPPHFNELSDRARDVDVFISAQNTHDRRDDCFATLNRVKSARVEAYETEGFTQGMGRDDYAAMMCSAKIAPAPSGPESAESFRVYEALEAHTIPICDDYSPKWEAFGFWEHLFPGCPLPVINSYQQLPGYIEDLLYRWPANLNLMTAWWMRHKRSWTTWLRADLAELGVL